MEEVSEYTPAERKWYQDVSLEDADSFILANMKSAVRSVIAIGYYLKCIRDGKMYIEAGYESVYDYAKAKYGFSKSNAHRYMERNDKFSVEGNSPILAEEYREFSKSQLQEMLSLDEELLSKVTPDMTVKEIREMKRPERREIPYFEIPGQISISDFPDMFGEEEFLPQESAAIEETAVCAENNSFTIMPEELFPDAAKMQRNEEMRCENSSVGELLSAYDAGVIATSQPEIETETEGEELAEAFEEQQEEIKEYDRYILEELIEDVQEMLKAMEEYWKENQPRTYTRYRMQLDAYLLLLKTREEILDEL